MATYLREPHPAIKRFWVGNKTLKIISAFDNLVKGGVFWCIISPQYKIFDRKNIIAFTDTENGNIVYYFKGVEYLEEDMLKIIKMKAFS
jgi:hypothetical protein